MPDIRDTFLADILTHPEDDTPRLVYADWLQEYGSPNRSEPQWGEFIAAQCKIASLEAEGVPKDDRELSLALRTEKDLFRPWHLWQWIDGWHGMPGIPEANIIPRFYQGSHALLAKSIGHQFMWQLHFRRGFVYGVRCGCQEWIDYGLAIVSRWPISSEGVEFPNQGRAL